MTEYIGARRHAIFEQGHNSYEFFLKGKGRTFIKETIIADFSPVKALNQDAPYPELTSFSITPVFNFDKKFYSPAFTTNYQGTGSDSNLKKQYFSRVKEQSTQIISERILLPKPRSSEVCYVCRQFFQDYLEHVRSSKHAKAIKSSVFTNYIQEMIEKREWSKCNKDIKSKKIVRRGRPPRNH